MLVFLTSRRHGKVLGSNNQSTLLRTKFAKDGVVDHLVVGVHVTVSGARAGHGKDVALRREGIHHGLEVLVGQVLEVECDARMSFHLKVISNASSVLSQRGTQEANGPKRIVSLNAPACPRSCARRGAGGHSRQRRVITERSKESTGRVEPRDSLHGGSGPSVFGQDAPGKQ